MFRTDKPVERAGPANELGRWPANLVLDEEAARLLDEETGALASGGEPRDGFVRHAPGVKHSAIYGGGRGLWSKEQSAGRLYNDVGGASRFFYCAKADRLEREAGLHGMPVGQALKWSQGDQNDGAFQSPNTNPIVHNTHPTVKPVDLMSWLVRLVTPPGGVVSDPFSGSGTTGIAAVVENRRFIGFEKEAAYVGIARARIMWWEKNGQTSLERGAKALGLVDAAKDTRRLDQF